MKAADTVKPNKTSSPTGEKKIHSRIKYGPRLGVPQRSRVVLLGVIFSVY